MNKYPCGLIEDIIPLYIEGDISSDTKKIVEEHLKECKNCSSLVSEYSNDELKVDDFAEELPQADTFKKWMRRLKILGLTAIILIIFSAVTIGIIGYKAGEASKNNLLTLKTIVRTLNEQDLFLKEDKSKTPDDFNLNGIKPSVFSIGESKDTLLIYTFKSVSERDKILGETNKFTDGYMEVPYKAKNAFIVYIPFQVPQTTEDLEIYSKTKNMISAIVFKNLNDGKEKVYRGESESWEGTFTLKYYENWVKDENGFRLDSFSLAIPEIKYKMSDIDAVGPITLEYKTSNGSGKSTGLKLNKNGSANAGTSGSTSVLANDNSDITFIISWGDKEETFVLKLQK